MFMAAKLPVARPPSELSQGQTMAYVDRRFGYPIAMGDDADGYHVEQLQFVNGIPVGWKVARFCMHGVLDACTYCLWELVGTPLELASRNYKTEVFYVVYDEEGKIVRSVSADSAEGAQFAHLNWSKPFIDGLKVNTDKSLRVAYNNQGRKSSGAKASVPSPSPAAVVSPAVPSASSSYSVEVFERVTGEEFAYHFRLHLKESTLSELTLMRQVKNELRASVEDDYRSACGGARGESVQVDFPQFSAKNSIVEGRAEVTRIGVNSLTYDAQTQKGVISVRIGSRSFEDTRAWVRKNIETIVRDKNIALTTGKVPQDKRFFLGAERVLPGNILEIEFETE